MSYIVSIKEKNIRIQRWHRHCRRKGQKVVEEGGRQEVMGKE